MQWKHGEHFNVLGITATVENEENIDDVRQQTKQAWPLCQNVSFLPMVHKCRTQCNLYCETYNNDLERSLKDLVKEKTSPWKLYETLVFKNHNIYFAVVVAKKSSQ